MLRFCVLVSFWVQAMLPALALASEAVLMRERDGKFRTEIVLDDQHRGPGLIDSGATSVLLCARLARDLKLTLGETVQVATSNGRMETRRTLLRSLRIGAIEFRNVRALVETKDGDCTEIIIGMNVLRMLRFMLLADDIMVLVSRPQERRMR